MSDRRKVLIVDDEIDLCLLLKSYFLRKDYEVFLSHTLEDGLAQLKLLTPDILFLDNNLPDAEGWLSAGEIAKEYPKMYMVLISAFHPPLPEMPGNTQYQMIEKPISINDLDKNLADINLQSTK
ncbi:MAG: response regulator [Flavipsychrobacter sp.]